MTRLTVDWVMTIADTITDYDRYLYSKVSLSLRDLAFDAAGRLDADKYSLLNENKAAVIRNNTGEGVIGGFDIAVASILKLIGIETILCDKENISGINEAMDKGANILFMADDEKYIAINTRNNKKSDNDHATALGFATVLEKMADGLTGKDIALLGYGKIGGNAADIMTDKGGNIWLYDKKDVSADGVKYAGTILTKERIGDYKLIFDATSEGSWITPEIPITGASIVAPGIPLSFTGDRFEKDNDILHDMLQIGTAVMLAEVL